MGHRYRHMYYATGLPGWMRFGYSPGWGGLPPGATYLTTGQWPTPQMAAAWQSGGVQPGQGEPTYGPTAPGYGASPWAQPGQVGPTTYGPTGPGYGASPEQELEFLKNQAQMLEQQMDQILKRIDEIEKEEKPKKK